MVEELPVKNHQARVMCVAESTNVLKYRYVAMEVLRTHVGTRPCFVFCIIVLSQSGNSCFLLVVIQ